MTDKYILENRVKQNELLVSFKARTLSEVEHDSVFELLYNSYYTIPKKSISEDLIEIELYSQESSQGIKIGDIAIENDTLKILVCNVLEPHTVSVTESEIIYLNYKIKNDKKIDKMPILFESKNLIKN